MAEYIYYMTKYNIPTIFLDFDIMISEPKYLFDKLENILNEKNISFDEFLNVFQIVSKTCK